MGRAGARGRRGSRRRQVLVTGWGYRSKYYVSDVSAPPTRYSCFPVAVAAQMLAGVPVPSVATLHPIGTSGKRRDPFCAMFGSI